MNEQERIAELEQEVTALKLELTEVLVAKDDVVDKLEKCIAFATNMKLQRDEAMATANKLIEVLEKLQGNAPKTDGILLPGNMDKAGNKKIII